MSEEAATPAPEVSNADTVASMVAEKAEPTGDSTDYGFVLDKYRAEGRTDEQAAIEQAKAYPELHSKFGSFTGAPDEYELSLSPEMSEKIKIDDFKDDPLLAGAKLICKDMGINNDGFNKLTEIFFKSQLSESEAVENIRAEELKSLGGKGEQRLQNLDDWAKQNLDSDTSEALLNGLTTASMVNAVEALISKSRNVQQANDIPAAPALSREKLAEMQNETDQYGNKLMSTSPEHRAKVEKGYSQLLGDEPHNVVIG